MIHRHHRRIHGFTKRFLVKKGLQFITVPVTDIAYCFEVNQFVCLVDHQGKQHLLDISLEDILPELDPQLFFRLNKKYIVHLHAIGDVMPGGKGRLSVSLLPAAAEEVLVSSEQTLAFKDWMTR